MSASKLQTSLAAMWQTHHQAIAGKRFDEWTDKDRHHYELSIVVQGFSYAYFGLRLNHDAEAMVASADLEALAETVLARLHDEGDPVVSGFVADLLNRMAREQNPQPKGAAR